MIDNRNKIHIKTSTYYLHLSRVSEDQGNKSLTSDYLISGETNDKQLIVMFLNY